MYDSLAPPSVVVGPPGRAILRERRSGRTFVPRLRMTPAVGSCRDKARVILPFYLFSPRENDSTLQPATSPPCPPKRCAEGLNLPHHTFKIPILCAGGP